ncbi:hypothetical protein L5515_004329 [Caenorhabditis briggsae]|uniref:Protein CBR-BATH-41 n=2 Tax=Caenorhabditis TaxID=6237 RepID=A0AAE9JCP8_CAEBR|nr:hypothetical protein L5515_004329 [Caenorhabditis briggsae]
MDGNNPQNQEQNQDIPNTSRSPVQRVPSGRAPSIVSSCSTRMTQRNFSNYWSVETFTVQLELHQHGEYMLAPKFGDSDYEFVMKLFPNGKDEDTAGYLSLFLLINKCPNPRLRFRVSFTVETADGSRSCHLNKNLVTINRSGIVTASKFFSLDIIKSSPGVYTPNDVLTIGCQLTIFGESLTWTTNQFSPYSRKLNMSMASICGSATPDRSSSRISSSTYEGIGFHDALDTGAFSDFTVVASCGREFPTHMVVLSARSDYFRALLRNENTLEFTSKRVKFEDISAGTLEVVLRHLYKIKTEISPLEEEHLTRELVSAVDRLMIPTMRDEIADMIGRNVTAENVVTRISMADELNLQDTYHCLLELFATHKKEVLQSAPYIEMKEVNPKLALKIVEDAWSSYDDPVGTLDRRIIDRITIN